MSSEEEQERKKIYMDVIYKALEDGWSVKKSDNGSRTFEFTKNKKLHDDFKGLLVVGNNEHMMENIQNHMDQLDLIRSRKAKKKARSISTPVTKLNLED